MLARADLKPFSLRLLGLERLLQLRLLDLARSRADRQNPPSTVTASPTEKKAKAIWDLDSKRFGLARGTQE